MQRVRVGLTGLACVFLLVFLAAAFFGLVRRADVPPPSAAAAARDGGGNVAAAAPPQEPLAELGVTPGNVPSGPAEAQPAPVPAHAPASR